MKKREEKPRSNAGRKPIADKKIPVVLLVEKSKIVGEDHLDMDIKSKEFHDKVNDLKEELYSSIEFTRGK